MVYCYNIIFVLATPKTCLLRRRFAMDKLLYFALLRAILVDVFIVLHLGLFFAPLYNSMLIEFLFLRLYF